MRGISTAVIAGSMSTKSASVNFLLNASLSLAGATQNGARCIGFEEIVVDEGGLGDLEAASHEAVILVWNEGRGLGVLGLGQPLLIGIKDLVHSYQTSQHHRTDNSACHRVACHIHQFGLRFSRQQHTIQGETLQ
jgi:hypothetical protein